MEEWQPSPCATFSPTWHQRFSLFSTSSSAVQLEMESFLGFHFWHFWKVSVSHLPRAKALWLHDTLDIFEYHMTGNARNPLRQIPQLSSLKSTYCVELDEDSCFGQCLGQKKGYCITWEFWGGLNFFQPVQPESLWMMGNKLKRCETFQCPGCHSTNWFHCGTALLYDIHLTGYLPFQEDRLADPSSNVDRSVLATPAQDRNIT